MSRDEDVIRIAVSLVALSKPCSNKTKPSALGVIYTEGIPVDPDVRPMVD